MLPEKGSLKFASIAKRDPVAAKTIAESVEKAIAEDPRASELSRRYMEAVREHARLKSLQGQQLEAHMSAAESDLRLRACNAAIANIREGRRSLVPSPETPAQAPAIESGPGYPPITTLREERTERAIFEEVTSCLKPTERKAVISTLARGDEPPAKILGKLPTVSAKRLKAPQAAVRLGSMLENATKNVARLLAQSQETQESDASEETGRLALKLIARGIRLALSALTGIPMPAANKNIQKNTPVAREGMRT